MKLSYPSNKICPFCSTGGYVWYLKDSEYVAKCTNCGHYFHKEDFPLCVLDSDPKQKTNADKIRAMTDEELADWFIKIQDDISDYYDGGHAFAPELPTLKNSWLDWLKQEEET